VKEEHKGSIRGVQVGDAATGIMGMIVSDIKENILEFNVSSVAHALRGLQRNH
jgi:hypothetical protein